MVSSNEEMRGSSSWLEAAVERVVSRFEDAWQSGRAPKIDDYLTGSDGVRQKLLIELIHTDLEYRLKAGKPAIVESYLKRYSQLADDRESVLGLIAAEYDLRRQLGTPLRADEYLQRFPQYGDELTGYLNTRFPQVGATKPSAELVAVQCPECHGSIEISRESLDDETHHAITCPACDSVVELDAAGTKETQCDSLAKVGRFAVLALLGQGASGTVYLAQDEELERRVAIKVPKPEAFAGSSLDSFLAEARSAAELKHPSIVTIYDVGHSADDTCYVVMEYVEGRPLSEVLAQRRLPPDEAARMIIQVADAMHYAHRMGLVHRDLKPANILLDNDNAPHIADFGLAIREHDQPAHEGEVAGTPAYMSPEQVRGESHRLDGRTDVWSLGVILYRMSTGRLPFGGTDLRLLFDEILHREPKPPRQIDDSIPPGLERTCLKCLTKRMADRYTTAADLAAELRDVAARRSRVAGLAGNTVVKEQRSPSLADKAVKVIPKGLRCFDAHDADFYLRLIPGPRDRDGLPDSVRFWKKRIESTKPDETFPVGLLYGPSGCGKSSLIKAGLLPRLSNAVVPVYVEATAPDTEARLLAALRHQCPYLEQELGLVRSLAALRKFKSSSANRKLLIVIDQFEQWLHAHGNEPDSDLARSLRHCDGVHVQCLLMVRDDFWMAIIRFMHKLEIPLAEGENSAAVDLFDPLHARAVLLAFGQAYGRLPDYAAQLSAEQDQFLDRAVTALAEDGKIVPIRLSVFAEMLKGKVWTRETLRLSGGPEGVGVTFLEESFVGRTAPPEQRRHQHAVRHVMNALLPAEGTDTKGKVLSKDELLSSSTYTDRPQDFAELLRILDNQLRLITPTDPQRGDVLAETGETKSGTRFYQLTHDFLVPSLRTWLTEKQQETWRGRAELCLGQRSAQWQRLTENRFLPSLSECLKITLLTRAESWTPTQQRMMRRARRRYVLRVGVTCMVVLMIGLLVRWLIPPPPSPLDVFLNPKAESEDRIRAFDRLPRDEAEVAVCVERQLQEETDPRVLEHAAASTFPGASLAVYRNWNADPQIRIQALSRVRLEEHFQQLAEAVSDEPNLQILRHTVVKLTEFAGSKCGRSAEALFEPLTELLKRDYSEILLIGGAGVAGLADEVQLIAFQFLATHAAPGRVLLIADEHLRKLSGGECPAAMVNYVENLPVPLLASADGRPLFMQLIGLVESHPQRNTRDRDHESAR